MFPISGMVISGMLFQKLGRFLISGTSISGMLLISGITVPEIAKAYEYKKVCDPKDPKSCVQPLLEGETAPFSGQLMTFRKAATVSVRAAGCQERIDLKLKEVDEIWEKKIIHEKKLVELNKKFHEKELELLWQQIEDMEDAANSEWYTHPIVISGITVATTIAIYYTAVAGIKAINQK